MATDDVGSALERAVKIVREERWRLRDLEPEERTTQLTLTVRRLLRIESPVAASRLLAEAIAVIETPPEEVMTLSTSDELENDAAAGAGAGVAPPPGPESRGESKCEDDEPADSDSPGPEDEVEPLDIDSIDLRIVHCERVEIRLPDGRRTVQLRGNNGLTFQYVRKLEKALMGAVYAAVRCGDAPDYTARIDADAYVAVKQLQWNCIRERINLAGAPCKEDALRELKIMRYFSSPGHSHVCRLIEVFSDSTNLYAVMEFCPGGDLFARIKDHVHPEDGSTRLVEADAKRYFVQCILATHYMHNKSVSHRDLSCENSMLASSDDVKIIDFGLGIAMPGPEGAIIDPDRVGKPGYMAPEVYGKKSYNPVQADVWSLGVMLFIKLFGVPPFQVPHAGLCQAYRCVAAGHIKALLDAWGLSGKVSADAIGLVISMLTVDPARRITIEQISQHPWLAEYRDLFPAADS